MASSAEELGKRVVNLFADNMENDDKISDLWETAHNSQDVAYADAYDFSVRTGETLSNAFKAVRKEIPETIDTDFADSLLRGALEDDYKLVSDVSAAVQQTLNEKAGLGLKAQTAPLNTDRINGLVNKFASYDKAEDAMWLLDAPVKTFSQSIVDDTIRTNAEFQSKAGLRPRIIRRDSGGCCDWCAKLAGTYDYPGVPREVYRRHANCNCTVEYDPGSGKRVQDVWSKRWTRKEESGKIERRKEVETGPSIRKVKNSSLKNGLSLFGKANSVVDKIVDNGQVLQRRLYGPDGKALVDYDLTDHGMPWLHPTGAHKHVFQYDGETAKRSKWQYLSEEDLETNSDIIKRGENYNDEI